MALTGDLNEMLGTARTFLFVPGHRPDRFDKAAAAGADVVVIDLEDAVSAEDKASARDLIAQWFEHGRRAAIRINAAGTQWHADDVALAARLAAPAMLAKAQSRAEVDAVGSATGAPVIALIETARGIVSASSIAECDSVHRLAFGALDFADEISVDPNDREALRYARSVLVTASAAAGIGTPVDGVTTALRDPDILADDVGYAARIGMRGKLCIHPTQVAGVHAGLAPTEDEIAWAHSIVDAAAGGPAAVAVDGHMVDPPVLARARRILAAAE